MIRIQLYIINLFKVKMKKLFCIPILIFCSNTYAKEDCGINTFKQPQLQNALKKHGGWTFNKFDYLCNKLEFLNAGLYLDQVSLISDNQTTVVTTVKAYPREYEAIDKSIILTPSGSSAVAFSTIKTTIEEERLKAVSANYALEQLFIDDSEGIIKDLKKIRKVISDRH